MHHRSGIVALLFGLTALSVAPRARADGFFVTFSPGQRVSPAVSRIAGASFDASGTSPIDAASGLSTGQTLTLPVHIEVDDVRLLAPLLSEETKFENVPLVTIEFTTPDAAGVEQVYMVGKYVNCTITAWQLKVYNFLTPLFRLLDPILPMSGLSTIVVAKK